MFYCLMRLVDRPEGLAESFAVCERNQDRNPCNNMRDKKKSYATCVERRIH